MTDAITAKRDLNAETLVEGDIILDDDLTITRNLSLTTEEGDIEVGKTVDAGNDVSITTGTGNIKVGKDVATMWL